MHCCEQYWQNNNLFGSFIHEMMMLYMDFSRILALNEAVSLIWTQRSSFWLMSSLFLCYHNVLYRKLSRRSISRIVNTFTESNEDIIFIFQACVQSFHIENTQNYEEKRKKTNYINIFRHNEAIELEYFDYKENPLLLMRMGEFFAVYSIVVDHQQNKKTTTTGNHFLIFCSWNSHAAIGPISTVDYLWNACETEANKWPILYRWRWA